MNNLKFDPFTDTPSCDICGAVCASIVTKRGGGQSKIVSEVTFACGASWGASIRALFDTSKPEGFPNGSLSAYDSRFSSWTELDECGNAVEIIRRQRTAQKEGP